MRMAALVYFAMVLILIGRVGEQFVSDIFFQQTVHEKPVPCRLDGVGHQVVSARLWNNALFRQLVGEWHGGGCHGTDELRELGFGAIVWWTQRAGSPPPQILERGVGEPEDFGDAQVFSL